LTWIKAEVANRQAVIMVELSKTNPVLIKTELSAKADVDFFFDLHNRTNSPSPELEAIYFYTGPKWNFSQDNQECLSTDSDLADYRERHFLKPPVRRLHAGSWAQIKITGKKYVAFAIGEGKRLEDKYRVTGRALMRLVTSEGTFDYPLKLDITVQDEIPF